MLKKTALWSGAIDIRVSTFKLIVSGLYIYRTTYKRKSMRDFNFKGFDSYVKDLFLGCISR